MIQFIQYKLNLKTFNVRQKIHTVPNTRKTNGFWKSSTTYETCTAYAMHNKMSKISMTNAYKAAFNTEFPLLQLQL